MVGIVRAQVFVQVVVKVRFLVFIRCRGGLLAVAARLQDDVPDQIKRSRLQDDVPSRADCPGYDIPLEKTPRQIDSGLDSDNYYPSGERRPAQGEMTQIK